MTISIWVPDRYLKLLMPQTLFPSSKPASVPILPLHLNMSPPLTQLLKQEIEASSVISFFTSPQEHIYISLIDSTSKIYVEYLPSFHLKCYHLCPVGPNLDCGHFLTDLFTFSLFSYYILIILIRIYSNVFSTQQQN